MAKARLVKVIWLAILYLSFSIDLIAGFADFKLGSEPYGFRGIIWGTDISRLKDMKYLATKDGVKYYSRKGDLLKIGAAKLEIVAYGFWNDKFSEVLVKTDGFDNYNKLKDAIFDNYGEGMKQPQYNYGYGWLGPITGMLIDYIEAENEGKFQIWSQDIYKRKKAASQGF